MIGSRRARCGVQFLPNKEKGDAHSPAVVAAAVGVVVAVAAASPSRSSYNGFSRYNFRIFFSLSPTTRLL